MSHVPVQGQCPGTGNLGQVKIRRLVPVLIAAGLALAGCGSDPAPETTPVNLETPTVALVDAGDGPGDVIRYADDGAEQNAKIVITQGFTQRAEGAGADPSADSTTPDTRLEMPVTVDVDGSGAERSATATVGTPFGSNAGLNEDIATAEGFVAQWRSDDTGLMRDLAIGAPEKATDTARAGIEAALMQWARTPVAFPSEPIGPGATWTVSTRGGEDVPTDQTLTYTLISREGDVVKLKVEVGQKPTVTELDAGDGVTAKVLDSGTETRSGELTVDLGSPLPTEGVIDYVSTVTYGGESDVRIVQQTHRAVQFGS